MEPVDIDPRDGGGPTATLASVPCGTLVRSRRRAE